MVRTIIAKAGVIAAGIVLFSSTLSFSADAFTDKGSYFLNGTASFSTVGLEDVDDRYTTLTLMPSVYYFPVKNIMVGPSFLWTGTFHGDYGQSQTGIGCNVGYTFGNNMPASPFLADASIIPFVATGFHIDIYSRSYDGDSDSESGFTLPLRGGVIVPIVKHFAATIESAFLIQSIDGNGMNTFLISIGFGGMIF